MAKQFDTQHKDFILKKIKEFFPDVEILAFGSRILGTAKKYSDLDLALKGKSKLSFSKMLKLKDAFSESNLPFKIDLQDFNLLGDDFKKIVEQTKSNWTNDSFQHPWRLCPSGQYWRKQHPRKLSKGGVADVDGHCVRNPSGKDQIYKEEIERIAEKFFVGLGKSLPKYSERTQKRDWNIYDDLFCGWTRYWNEVFRESDPLDPILVKALIATESSFDPKAKPSGKSSARGIIQLNSDAVRALKDEKGEVRDHFITLDLGDRENPNLAISAGVRWLFHKRKLASNRLNRTATWREAIIEYKGYWRVINSDKAAKGMQLIETEMSELKEKR